MSPELLNLQPDSWHNIPLCLVHATGLFIEQFSLQEKRIGGITSYNHELIKKREQQIRGLEHYVARSNDTLRGQIDFNCNRMLEKIVRYGNENMTMNERTQIMISQSKILFDEQVRDIYTFI